MSIPGICRKKDKASDEKYFLSMYLSQIEVFKGLPTTVMELIVSRLGCRTYRAGEVVHGGEEEAPGFMGVVFVGAVVEREGRKNRSYGKQEVVLRSAFYQKQLFTTITARE